MNNILRFPIRSIGSIRIGNKSHSMKVWFNLLISKTWT